MSRYSDWLDGPERDLRNQLSIVIIRNRLALSVMSRTLARGRALARTAAQNRAALRALTVRSRWLCSGRPLPRALPSNDSDG